MVRYIHFIFFLVFFATGTFKATAQSKNMVVDTPLVSFKNKPKLFLTFDRTSSFVSGKGATTNEIRMGLDFKKKIRFGIGFAGLASDIVANKTIVTQNTSVDSIVPAKLTLSYLSLSGEYTFYESKRWQITMPVVIGFGSSYFSYYEKINGSYKTKRTDEGGVILMGPSGVVTYRILRWIGLSGGIGYRHMIVNNSKVKESFNSPIYLFRVRIFMGEIYKTVFPRGIFGKHDPPYKNEYWD